METKMGKLLPSARERKRYILFKVTSDSKFEKDEISQLVTKAGLQFLGELGMAKAGIQFLPETWKNQTGVIRTAHNMVDEARAALTLVKEYEGRKLAIQTIRTSGVIGKLKELQEKIK